MRIIILGCGYVGIELGRQLAAAGHSVIGVRRSADGLDAVRDAGLDAVQADVTEPTSLESIPDGDAIVYAVSSGGRGAANARDAYVEGLRTTVSHFGDRSDPPDRLIYTSSTGVYGDHDGEWVDESTPVSEETARQQILVEAERIAIDGAASQGIAGTVARYAGLYGPSRYRVDRYLTRPVTDSYLNLVHRADAAGAVRYLLETDSLRDDIVLVVDNEPVTKWEFADWLAGQLGRTPPEKQSIADRLSNVTDESRRRRIAANKRCSNEKLRSLGYEYAYPTYREGYQPAIAAYQRDA